MAQTLRLSEPTLYRLLMGADGEAGVFERTLGFSAGTGAVKGVHVMNDLAQCVLGGAPTHKGDLLCRVIREDHLDEDNDDASLRADLKVGLAYVRAFPPRLGGLQTSRLRGAIGKVVNADLGIYQAGTDMASGLVTHRDLLGFEGFRRFRVGRHLQRLLGPEGEARLCQLFLSGTDPLARALAPLWWEAPLLDKHPARPAPAPLTPFDVALGGRLAHLLEHPVSKPLRLRFLLLGASLGLMLKVLGVGQPDGRPSALATVAASARERPLRSEAVQTFARGISAFDRRMAEVLAAHPEAEALWRKQAGRKEASIEVPSETDPLAQAQVTLRAAREHKWSGNMYWPEDFVISLGRKAGCVLPLHPQAGWGKHIALTPDLVEVLVLMFTDPGARPVPWRVLWGQIADELGLMVGANLGRETERLHAMGVLHLDLDAIARNNDAVLGVAIARGVARRLPDSGAEAGGELT
jgi:hypothetical protein